jgi:protein-S-isoprenylcysteine O-methyltransferase Ste14
MEKCIMERKITIIILLAIFLISAILPRIIQKLKKIETVGCIGINKKIFFLGKISLFTSIALIPIQLFIVNLSLFEQRSMFFWVCAVLLAIGVMLFTFAVTKLGTFSLRVGLAQENTILRTASVYRLSRNPMLLGLYFMALSSAVYVQNPINWILVIIALSVHHKIILTEEVFMEKRFGDKWIEYTGLVRRYL